jgi:dTDP-L-rhamnose 4-epimerase
VHPHTVIHLAAETGTGQSLTEGTRHSSVNVMGTTQMLDAFCRHGRLPNTLILASSRAVYGEGAWKSRADGQIFYPVLRSKAQLESEQWDFPNADPLPMSADIEPRPTSIYGATKLAQEHIVSCWCSAFDVSAAILRLQNVYGPGQSLTNSYTGIVSLFGRQAMAGQRIEIYEDGRICRDFVYIDDVVNAFIAVLDKGFGSVSTRDYILDIGSGTPTTLEAIARMIASHFSAPLPSIVGKFRHGDVRHASSKVDRAKSALSWSPEWSAKRGVNALCAWIEGHQHEFK